MNLFFPPSELDFLQPELRIAESCGVASYSLGLPTNPFQRSEVIDDGPCLSYSDVLLCYRKLEMYEPDDLREWRTVIDTRTDLQVQLNKFASGVLSEF